MEIGTNDVYSTHSQIRFTSLNCLILFGYVYILQPRCMISVKQNGSIWYFSLLFLQGYRNGYLSRSERYSCQFVLMFFFFGTSFINKYMYVQTEENQFNQLTFIGRSGSNSSAF